VDLSEYDFIQYQKEHKQGYIEYDWKNPGEEFARPKALYMIYFEPWDWIISASSYRSEFAQLVQVNDFKDEILSLIFGTTGYSYIVDTDGRIILHGALEEKEVKLEQLKKKERIETIISKKSGKLVYSIENETSDIPREKLVIFNFIKEFDWIVVASGYVDELYAPLRTIRAIFSVTIFMVLVFVLPLSYSISNSITNPLEVLMDRFRKASEGDTSVRINRKSDDEVGKLAQYFNYFMRQLQKYSQSLMGEIEEQKKTKKKIARIRRYLAAIVDSMPSVLIGVDTLGQVTMWNKEAERSSRILEADAMGRALKDIARPLGIVAEMAEMANENKQIQIKERVEHPLLGKEVWADIVVYPLTPNVGHGSVIRIDDVSTRVKMKTLMVETEKMKTIAGLSAGMAHEINNPIGCIVQSAQNILRRVSPDLAENRRVADQLGVELDTIHAYLEERQIFHFIDDIRLSVDRTARTVSNMLGFSRKETLEKIEVDIGELIKTSIGLATHDYELKKKYDFKSIQINVEIDPETQKVTCIPGEIEQVLLNLLKNAAQAVWENRTTDRSSQIQINVEQQEKSVKIKVSDNGPGIDSLVLKRIFEPFYTTKSVGSGTGLGLSVAYYIITRNHNGTFSVESSPGKGATFIMTLPVKDEKNRS
jgi:two-component system NtrC family sensor kinase